MARKDSQCRIKPDDLLYFEALPLTKAGEDPAEYGAQGARRNECDCISPKPEMYLSEWWGLGEGCVCK